MNVVDSTNPIIKVDEEDEENPSLAKRLDLQRKHLQSYLKQKQNANKLNTSRMMSSEQVETKVFGEALINSTNNRETINKQNTVIADSFSLIEKRMLNTRNLMKKNVMIKSKYTPKNRSSIFESKMIEKSNDDSVIRLRNDQNSRPQFLDEYEYAISQKSIKIKSASKSEENYASGESVNFDDEYVDNKVFEEENYQSEYEYEDYEEEEEDGDRECCKKKYNCCNNLKYEDQEYEYEYDYEYEEEEQDENYDYDGCKYDEECQMGENEYDDVNFDESGNQEINEKILTGKIKLDEEDIDEQSYLDLSSAKVDRESEDCNFKIDSIIDENESKSNFDVDSDIKIVEAKLSEELNNVLKKVDIKIESIQEEDELECDKKSLDNPVVEAEIPKHLENSITCTSF